MTGRDALDCSQASAEAETGVLDSPILPCQSWIGVAALYDDPWKTPVTNSPVRIKVAGGLVADGPRTKSLASYGKQDGQPHLNVRPLLGSYRQNGVKRGEADIALVPTGAASQVTELEKQIISTLTAFDQSMRAKLQPWITEWTNKGWMSVLEAKRRGYLKGLSTWWEGEVDFWSSVSHVAQDVWKGIKRGASTVANWYDDLPWYEKINPPRHDQHRGMEAGQEAVGSLRRTVGPA